MDAVLRRRTWRCASVLTLLVVAAQPSVAVERLLDERAALAASQAVITRSLGDYRFVDARGRPFMFSDLHGRPVILSLVYTSCYEVCSGLTVHLREVVDVARKAAGADSFTVLTVGFDTANDTPERMRLYAADRRAERPGWYFASTDAATIERLARDVGFTYRPSSRGFDHITQTTIIDGAGRVMLQVYGEDFEAPLLVEPLKRLLRGENIARGTLAGLVESVRLFCTIYDPATGRYRFDYALIVEVVAGILALGMVAVAIGRASRDVR
jgi:protein SCO1/2